MGNPAITDVYSVEYFEGSVVVAGVADFSEPATVVEEAPIAGTTLVIANAASEGLKPGVTVQGSISGATGIVESVSDTEVRVSLTSTTVFSVGDTLSIPSGTYGTFPGSPFTKTSGTLTNQFLPIADLEAATSYYARVTYSTTNSLAATSHPSPWVQFSTGDILSIEPGTIIFGGGYAGQLNIGGTIYNLLACPDPDINGTSARAWSNAVLSMPTNAEDLNYGGNTTFNNANATFPWFDYICNDPNGPNAGQVDLTNSVGSGINGYNDWYMAALYEALSVYYFLKPSIVNNQLSETNNVTGGRNPISVAPYNPDTAWTLTNPAQTNSVDWKEGGQYAYADNGAGFRYTASLDTPNSASTTWFLDFGTGSNNPGNGFTPPTIQRATIVVRRQPA